MFITVLFEHYLTGLQLFLLSLFIITSIVNSGAILDQRKWIFYLEYSRIVLILVAAGVFYPGGWPYSLITAIALVMLLFVRILRRLYLRLLYA